MEEMGRGNGIIVVVLVVVVVVVVVLMDEMYVSGSHR